MIKTNLNSQSDTKQAAYIGLHWDKGIGHFFIMKRVIQSSKHYVRNKDYCK